MSGKAPVDAVFEALTDRYEPAQEHAARDPFAVLVATILSHRTDDEVTHEAAWRLLEAYPTVHRLARADPEHVADLIKPVGFYNRKAKALPRAAQHLLEHHDGCVPTEEAALLEIPWVGRKTMNCVLVYAFGRSVVAVDTHVHRIANRLGWADTETPEATEKALATTLDDEQKRLVNELLVRLGREICRPRVPRCGDCPLPDACPSREDKPPDGLDQPEGPTMLSRVARAT